MATTLLDTGVVLALFDKEDSYYEEAGTHLSRLQTDRVIILWPILYETLGTRFVKRPEHLRAFRSFAARHNVILMNDAEYREQGLVDLYRLSLEKRPHRPLSLVDSVLRCFMEDRRIKVDFLLTFNRGDFSDVCRSRRVQLL